MDNTRILRPIQDRLVVRPLSADALEVKKEGTLIITPETAKERPMVGVVIAVGPDVKQIARRDVVVYGKYSGNELTLNSETVLVLQEKEVFSVVVSNDAEPLADILERAK